MSPLTDTTLEIEECYSSDFSEDFTSYYYLNGISHNKGIPSDELGLLPLDIIYLSGPSTYYVYGGDKIITLDGETHEITQSYDIPLYGSFTDQKPFIPAKFECFAHVPEDQKLFCATAGHELFIINTDDNTINPYFSLPEDIPYNGIQKGRIILKYYPGEDKLFWAVNQLSGSYLFIFDLSSGTNEYNIIPYNGKISDVEFSPISQKYYVSIRDIGYSTNNSKVIIYNSTNNVEIDHYYHTEAYSYYSLIKYVYLPDVSFQKLVCTPDEIIIDQNTVNTLLIIDPYDDSFSTIPMPAEKVNDIEIKPPDKLFFSYTIDNFTGGQERGILEATLASSTITDWLTIYSAPYPFSNPIDMELSYINNEEFLLCTTNDEWLQINLDTYAWNRIDFINNLLHKISLNEESQEVMVANYRGGSLEFFDQPGVDLNETITIGNSGFHGFYCDIEEPYDDKVFFYAKHKRMTKSKLFSLNIVSQEVDLVYERAMISGCQYEPENEIILISSVDVDSDIINIISANPGTSPIEDEIYLDTEGAACREIFISNDGFLYCLAYLDVGATYLEVWNASTLQFIKKHKINALDPGLNTISSPFAYFYHNDKSHEIYLSLRDLEHDGEAIIGLDEYNEIKFAKIVQAPGKLTFDSHDETIYFIANAHYSLWKYHYPDENPSLIEQFSDETQIVDIEFSDNTHYLYLSIDYRNDPYALDEIKVYDCSNQNFLSTPIITGGMPMSLKYNPSSHIIYALLPINKYADYSMEVLRIDEDNFIIDKISFDQKNFLRGQIVYTVMDLILGQNNDVYSAGAFSKINIIEEDHGCTSEEYNDHRFSCITHP